MPIFQSEEERWTTNMLVGTGLATEIVPLLRQGQIQFTAWNIVRDLPPQGQVPLVVAVVQQAYVSCLVALRTLKESKTSARDDKNAVASSRAPSITSWPYLWGCQ